MFGVAERGSVMVKSCLINASFYAALTDGPRRLLREAAAPESPIESF